MKATDSRACIIGRTGRPKARIRCHRKWRRWCSRCAGHPYWGARRIAFELARKRVERAPSESAVYRCLVRAAVIDPISRQRRRETWKRWERGAPMELWQLDLVHGFLLADGTSVKALTSLRARRLKSP